MPQKSSSTEFKLSAQEIKDYYTLFSKKSLTITDFPEIKKVMHSPNLSPLKAAELYNHISDYGTDELVAAYQQVANTTDPKLRDSKLRDAALGAYDADDMLIALIDNNQAKLAKLDPDVVDVLNKIHPSIIDALKQAKNSDNIARFHDIEEYIDHNDATKPMPAQQVKNQPQPSVIPGNKTVANR